MAKAAFKSKKLYQNRWDATKAQGYFFTHPMPGKAATKLDY